MYIHIYTCAYLLTPMMRSFAVLHLVLTQPDVCSCHSSHAINCRWFPLFLLTLLLIFLFLYSNKIKALIQEAGWTLKEFYEKLRHSGFMQVPHGCDMPVSGGSW